MKVKKKVKSLSHVQLFATSWTAAHQAPPSVEFSSQEYWSGVPLSSPSTGFVRVNSVMRPLTRASHTLGCSHYGHHNAYI